jgi:hypothetical protein
VTSSEAITLFTSIPPRMSRLIRGNEMGPAWQMACINSWKASGFKAISFNNPDEICLLRSLDADVEFSAIPAQHKRPQIVDFLDAAIASGSKVVGIINADCLLVPQPSLVKNLMDLNGLVIAERINLDTTTFRSGGYPCMGFDAFFFDTKALSKIDRDERWRLGDTWWDYWFPLAFQAAGFEPKTLPAPIMVHMEHDLAWNAGVWESSFSKLNNFVRSTDLRDPVLTAATKKLPPTAQAEDILSFGSSVYSWLHSREALWYPESGSVDDLVTQFLNATAMPPMPGRGRTLIRQAVDALGLGPIVASLGLR